MMYSRHERLLPDLTRGAPQGHALAHQRLVLGLPDRLRPLLDDDTDPLVLPFVRTPPVHPEGRL